MEPQRRVASGSAAYIGPARVTAHIAAGIVGWIAFAGLWVWQLAVFIPERWLDGVMMIAFFVAAFAVVTPAWVAWNRNIYQRRHRRTSPLLRAVQFERDSLGRTLVVAPGVLLSPIEVIVTADAGAGTKRYANVERPAPAERPAMPVRESQSA